MIVSITYLKLRSPFKLVALAKHAKKIQGQLRESDCKEHAIRGFWNKHYTISLWPNEESMQSFVRSGAHLDAMKATKSIAKEVCTIHFPANELPKWKDAKQKVKGGRVIKY